MKRGFDVYLLNLTAVLVLAILVSFQVRRSRAMAKMYKQLR